MKNKDFENGVYCVEYAIMNLTDEEERRLHIQFTKLEDYKNELIRHINNKINDMRKDNKDFDNALNEIDLLTNKEGKIVEIDERSERLSNAYKVISTVIGESKLLTRKTVNDFKKNMDASYNIWLPDDVSGYAGDDVLTGFNKLFFGKGKHVTEKKYGTTCSMRFKPSISNKGNKNSSNGRVIYVDGKPKFRAWDLSTQSINPLYEDYDAETKKFRKGRCGNHKFKEYDLYCSEKDELQKFILTNPYIGNTKIIRYWKKGKWRYRVQVNFERKSPIIDKIENYTGRVAIDFGTETVAIVRDDGYQEIIEMTPNTPRIIDEIKEIDRYLDNSRRATNPEMFREDGTVISKKEAYEKGIKWNYSNRYKRAVSRRKELYRLLREQRKLNNLVTSKYIFTLGDDFITENNSFVAWGHKGCRLTERGKKKYLSGQRHEGRDYTKQIHDRAPAQIDERIEHLSKQKGFDYSKLKRIQGFDCSTYNHFTKQNDVFTKLNDRLIVVTDVNISERYKDITNTFSETYETINNEGKEYVLQRDLYAAAKMLFCKSYTEKSSRGKDTIKYKFDQDGFVKFFNEKFYPKHQEYLLSLRNSGNKLSGTIFGNI